MKPDTTYDLLCACLSVAEDPARRVALRRRIDGGAIDWPDLVRAASSALVTTNLRAALMRQELSDILPAEVRTYLEGVHDLNSARNTQLAAQLAAAAGQLNAAGITPLVMKGVANLLAGVYADTGTRAIGDIDLLVAEEQLDQAKAALEAAGFRTLKDMREDMHIPPMARPGDVAHIELHTRVHTGRVDALLGAAEMLAEATPGQAGDAQVLIPSPTHRVLHNIIHTQIQDANYMRAGVSLRQLCDLVELRRVYGDAVDWTLVKDRLAAGGHGSALSHYVGWGERLLGQTRPPQVPYRRSEAVAALCHRLQMRSRRLRLLANTLTKLMTSLGWLRREPGVVLHWLRAFRQRGHLRLTFRRLGFRV